MGPTGFDSDKSYRYGILPQGSKSKRQARVKDGGLIPDREHDHRPEYSLGDNYPRLKCWGFLKRNN